MKKGQKNRVYRWLDNQICASRLMSRPLYASDPFYVNVCSGFSKNIHVYQIDNLCKELGISYKVGYKNDEYEEHYLVYKGYKFFGLVDVGKNNEGQ